MKNIKINKYQKGALIALAVFIIANPLTGQYVLKLTELLFDLIFTYAFGASVVAAVYLIIYVIITILIPKPINIPKKAKKSNPKFID